MLPVTDAGRELFPAGKKARQLGEEAGHTGPRSGQTHAVRRSARPMVKDGDRRSAAARWPYESGTSRAGSRSITVTGEGRDRHVARLARRALHVGGHVLPRHRGTSTQAFLHRARLRTRRARRRGSTGRHSLVRQPAGGLCEVVKNREESFCVAGWTVALAAPGPEPKRRGLVDDCPAPARRGEAAG